MPDIVYVLTNPAMPGFVKIGYTTQEDVQARMKQLHSTGVPEPFECVMAVQVGKGQANALEKALHTAFAPDQGNASREFFKMDPERVLAILRVWPGRDVTPKGNKRVKKRRTPRPRLNFDEMGIPVESTLTAISTGEEATVVGPKRVRFRGKEMSLSEATRHILNIVGTRNARPTPYWKFGLFTLREIYNNTYGARAD